MIKGLTIVMVIVSAGNRISSEDIVKVHAPGVTMRAGGSSTIDLSVEVMDGYHIQSNKADVESIIPTTLGIESDKEIFLRKQIFPKAKKFKLKGTDEVLDVYDGRFNVRISLGAGRKIRKGLHRLNGKMDYQACDSVRCLFPRVAEFTLEVEVR
jgi:hypothetical protein